MPGPPRSTVAAGTVQALRLTYQLRTNCLSVTTDRTTVALGPSRRSCPYAYGGFWSKQTRDIERPPRPAGSRSISRPNDRSTEPASGLGPFGSRSLRQEHRRHPYARFHDTTIRTGALVSPAGRTVAAASTYIRSSASYRCIPDGAAPRPAPPFRGLWRITSRLPPARSPQRRAHTHT